MVSVLISILTLTVFWGHQVLDRERFEHAFQVVLQHEGGLSLDKDDPGGATKYGISLRYLKDQGIDIDDDGDSDTDDILKLEKKDAKSIYHDLWWIKNHYNMIADLNVATKCLDLSVNMGAKTANKVIQRAINHIAEQDIKVDGIIGKLTISQINSIKPHVMLDELRLEAEEYYKNLVIKNKKLGKYLKGWLNRVAS